MVKLCRLWIRVNKGFVDLSAEGLLSCPILTDEPVAVAARSDFKVWVVNDLSDSSLAGFREQA